MAATYTINTNSSDKYLEMQNGVKSQLLRLKKYSVTIQLANVNSAPFYTIDIEMGNVMSSQYIIDNNKGVFHLELALDPSNRVTIGANHFQMYVCDCDIPMRMCADLPENYQFRVREVSTGQLLTELTNIFLQFELTE